MATTTANISWGAVSGATGYLVQYKEQSSSVWITPTSPANPTALTSYDITITTGTYYDLRIVTQCPNGGKIINAVMYSDDPVVYIWVPDTYTCEQDELFTLSLTVNGLSSPQSLMYYEPTDRFYVVDCDDASGNFWWFDPDTFSTAAGRNYVSGQPAISPNWLKTTTVDRSRNRLLASGDSSNGMIVYDIAANTFTTVAYGTNTTSFSRPSISILGSSYYCTDLSGVPSIYVVSADTLAITDNIPLSGIPSGSSYFNNSYSLSLVHGEVWVTCNSRSGSGAGDIAIYDPTFTTLIGTIVVPGAAAWAGGSGRYWQTHFYDQDKDRWYVHDIGSNTMHVIDATAKTVSYSHTFTNLQTKSNCNVGFAINSVTSELYASYFGLNDIADSSQILRFYKVNRDTYAFEDMFVGTIVSALSNRIGTNEFWSVSSGIFAWNVPDTGWDTDGQAFKYTL